MIARQSCEKDFDRLNIIVDPLELEIFINPNLSDVLFLLIP